MNELLAATAGLGPILAGVSLITLFGRDPHADEHDLSDYHEPKTVFATDWSSPKPSIPSVPLGEGSPEAAPWRDETADILPPAPEGMNAGSPIYAHMLFHTWHPENPADVAARFLREIAREVTR